ncbi:MAG: molybdopterin synthase sulfur carrier subunit [Leptolyngbya foveolarum]|uniref:Molybdopterin synthase sulfur carrier subunit n=1 Tax=Leptolyngbya foveolarum TaxID=47253 RepID=A0A2W4U2C3_9CYAN|nr:MAG: molybdopterin synthase sulfur carrier subunit [Leptolyngbya foveolarum]
MDKNTIEITLKLFAVYQEALGVEEKTLVVPVGTTAGEVCDRLIADHPELAQWKDLTRFGVNLQFVEAHTVLTAGDELVLIPPVSGG